MASRAVKSRCVTLHRSGTLPPRTTLKNLPHTRAVRHTCDAGHAVQACWMHPPPLPARHLRVVSPCMRVSARSRFSRLWCFLAPMLASLASLRDTAAHGIHSLLVPLPGLTVPDHVQHSPRSRSRSPVPKCAPHRRGSTWAQRGRLSHWPGSQMLSPRSAGAHSLSPPSLSPALAPVLQESADSVRASSLPTPRGGPASSHVPAAQPARQSSSDAADGRRRTRDKRRRRKRKQAKRSMWREI